MQKIIDLVFILVLGLSYVIVYDIGGRAANNECKIDTELKQIQYDTWVKPKGHKK